MASQDLEIQVKLLSPDAKAPTRAFPTDAGQDLYSSEDVIIPEWCKMPVSTGIAIAVPHGHYGRIAPKSGLAVKNGIDVLAGVVDSSFRGEILVILMNLSDYGYEVKKGQKIAQLICEKISYPKIKVVQELSETDRGTGGFGSSGQFEANERAIIKSEAGPDAKAPDMGDLFGSFGQIFSGMFSSMSQMNPGEEGGDQKTDKINQMMKKLPDMLNQSKGDPSKAGNMIKELMDVMKPGQESSNVSGEAVVTSDKISVD